MTRNSMDEQVPEPEVVAVAQRRQFSLAYKKRILEEARACTEPGEMGALLRREGLYSSLLSKWRQAEESGQLNGQEAQPRGRKPAPEAELRRELERAQRQVARLEAQLAQARAIIEIQKKVSQLLGLELTQNASDTPEWSR